MIETGKLDRLIAIERNTPTQDAAGQPIESWARIGAKRWAQLTSLYGQERFTIEQFIAREQVVFTVRWADDLATVSPLDRIVYPVVTIPTNSQIYDIIAVAEIGYRDGLKITAARRAEQ